MLKTSTSCNTLQCVSIHCLASCCSQCNVKGVLNLKSTASSFPSPACKPLRVFYFFFWYPTFIGIQSHICFPHLGKGGTSCPSSLDTSHVLRGCKEPQPAPASKMEVPGTCSGKKNRFKKTKQKHKPDNVNKKLHLSRLTGPNPPSVVLHRHCSFTAGRIQQQRQCCQSNKQWAELGVARHLLTAYRFVKRQWRCW